MLSELKDVKHYPYRTAFAEDRLVIIPRIWVNDLEMALCRAANVRQDNHVTFTFEWNDLFSYVMLRDSTVKTIVVTFHDDSAYFGTELLVKDW